MLSGKPILGLASNHRVVIGSMIPFDWEWLYALHRTDQGRRLPDASSETSRGTIRMRCPGYRAVPRHWTDIFRPAPHVPTEDQQPQRRTVSGRRNSLVGY